MPCKSTSATWLRFFIFLVFVLSRGATCNPTGQLITDPSTDRGSDCVSLTSCSDGAARVDAASVAGLWPADVGGNACTDGEWVAIASSSGGAVIVAASLIGHICVSEDSGTTWANQFQTLLYIPTAAASQDGVKLMVIQNGDNIRRSADSGQRWIEKTNITISTIGTSREAGATEKKWASIVSSADGVSLAAVAREGGNMWTSSDSGASWTERAPTSPSPG